jgi:hypothetical protein
VVLRLDRLRDQAIAQRINDVEHFAERRKRIAVFALVRVQRPAEFDPVAPSAKHILAVLNQ